MMPSRAHALVVLVLIALATVSCERRESRSPGRAPAGDPSTPTAPEFYKPSVNETFGVAVVILLDTSGSMGDPVPGATQTKDRVARKAIGSMLKATEEFTQAHPDRKVRVSLMHFSGTVSVDLPTTDYSAEAVNRALARIPAPDGNTAIGEGLREARRELYRSGCLSKHILVITDGENTTGVDPEKMAREIHKRSDERVKLYFVAFDTDPKKFRFLEDIGGTVLSAKGEVQLEASLKEIYEDKILAEEAAEEE
jgi:Mg-chelatase subunit ChlD